MKYCLWLLLIFATACVPGNQTGSSYDQKAVNYTVELPEHWVRVESNKHYMITKDGAFTQYILIQQRPLNKPFKHTKKTFNKGMLPQEAAEVVLDEIASDRMVMNFKIIENGPAKLSNHEGFRVVFTYKTKNGSAYKTIYHGLLKGDWFYSVRYNVSEKHDSPKEYETFEKFLNNFKIQEA